MAIYGIDGGKCIPYLISGALAPSCYDMTGDDVFPESSGDNDAFVADFSQVHPLPSQFYTWQGRTVGDAEIDALENIQCEDGTVNLVSYYSEEKGIWIRQLLSTGGLFEADNFTCSFKAVFGTLPGSWNNVITYGTGTHWTNELYSKGVKWPAGGEIDAFEQAGGYAANPNRFTPTVHWGAGSNSAYPDKHLAENFSSSLSLPIGEWADYAFSLENGLCKVYVNGTLVAQDDISGLVVNTEYLWNYKPFLKPQAFYIDAKFASGTQSQDTSTVYRFPVKDFKVSTGTDEIIDCESLELYPQMWPVGTDLVFPTNAEIYLDRIYTPSNTSNKACTWESSNHSIATVVQGYVVTKAEGQCIITATCGNATATYNLTVSNANKKIPCAGLLMGSTGLQLLENGSVDLASSIYKFPKFTTDTASVTSSDESVATVSGTTVYAVGLGDASITVSCGEKTLTIPVKVTNGIIVDTDVELKKSNQTIYSEPIEYDQTATYSFQYTFGSHTPVATSTAPNCIVGPTQSNNAFRCGSIMYRASTSEWTYYIGSSSRVFAAAAGDVLTFVHNFATGKANVYLNGTAIATNETIGPSYFTNTAKVIAGGDNASMTVAPVHVKIAIGNLH